MAVETVGELIDALSGYARTDVIHVEGAHSGGALAIVRVKHRGHDPQGRAIAHLEVRSAEEC